MVYRLTGDKYSDTMIYNIAFVYNGAIWLDNERGRVILDTISNAKNPTMEAGDGMLHILLVNTHNPIIDAILNQKGYAAREQDIDLHFEINDLSEVAIPSVDLTVVMSNLLDNAIEACLKLEEAKRRIEVSVLRDEAYADGDAKLYVSIINTSLPVHIEKDCIATTKLEPHLHGFGLPCAKELLRRNNAFYTMDYHDGAFQFCFEWPDVACNSCVHA